MFRLDLQPDGAYARVRETCLADQISRHLGGYDPNHFPSTDTSWVFGTDLENLVGR
jgi:hypothetical protein